MQTYMQKSSRVMGRLMGHWKYVGQFAKACGVAHPLVAKCDINVPSFNRQRAWWLHSRACYYVCWLQSMAQTQHSYSASDADCSAYAYAGTI